MRRRAWSVALAAIAGCELEEPEPTGVPFVSEQILGHWLGRWSVPLPGQAGEADVLVRREAGGEVSWRMSLDGGALSGPDDPPLLYDLRGQDDVHRVRLAGDGDKLGHIELAIDERGLIEGTSVPQSIPAVDIVGLVGEDYLRLDFLVLDVLHGNAVVTVEGRAVEIPDTDDPSASLAPE